jgi:hypothetical protein
MASEILKNPCVLLHLKPSVFVLQRGLGFMPMNNRYKLLLLRSCKVTNFTPNLIVK